VAGAIFLALGGLAAQAADGNWASYLGDPGRSHFSRLKQIHLRNVTRLEVAWTYHSGDARADNLSQIQCNPLIVDGVLYGTTPQFKLTAPPVLSNPRPTGAILLNLQHFAHSQGATLAVGLTLPEPRLQGFLKHHDIPFVDLTTLLRYPTNGFHWTPEGHTLVCDRIEEFLTKGKFLSARVPPPQAP
jgi:hypothetical protein